MIIRFLKALFDWLFIAHGYLRFKHYTGSLLQCQEMAIKQRLLEGKAGRYKCKVCNSMFWSVKHNPTCRRITCFFSYRMNPNHSKYSVTTKHHGIEKNHTVHAHSISEVLATRLLGKITQVNKIK